MKRIAKARCKRNETVQHLFDIYIGRKCVERFLPRREAETAVAVFNEIMHKPQHDKK